MNLRASQKSSFDLSRMALGVFGGPIRQCNLIIKNVINKDLGVPEPYDTILFVVWALFLIYVVTKTLHSILDICYGKK